MQQLGVISTNVARCRDCYRCVRPVPSGGSSQGRPGSRRPGTLHCLRELRVRLSQKARTSGTTVPLSRRQSRPSEGHCQRGPLLPGFLQRDVLSQIEETSGALDSRPRRKPRTVH